LSVDADFQRPQADFTTLATQASRSTPVAMNHARRATEAAAGSDVRVWNNWAR
jgi:hypothetical protein